MAFDTTQERGAAWGHGTDGGHEINIDNTPDGSSSDYFRPENAILGLKIIGIGTGLLAISSLPNLPEYIARASKFAGLGAVIVGAGDILGEVYDEYKGRKGKR